MYMIFDIYRWLEYGPWKGHGYHRVAYSKEYFLGKKFSKFS